MHVPHSATPSPPSAQGFQAKRTAYYFFLLLLLILLTRCDRNQVLASMLHHTSEENRIVRETANPNRQVGVATTYRVAFVFILLIFTAPSPTNAMTARFGVTSWTSHPFRKAHGNAACGNGTKLVVLVWLCFFVLFRLDPFCYHRTVFTYLPDCLTYLAPQLKGMIRTGHFCAAPWRGRETWLSNQLNPELGLRFWNVHLHSFRPLKGDASLHHLEFFGGAGGRC